MSAEQMEFTSLLPDDSPDEVTVQWVAEVFGITDTAVKSAIKTGKLPARRIRSRSGATALWLIRPEHTLLIWGHRLLRRAQPESQSETNKS